MQKSAIAIVVMMFAASSACAESAVGGSNSQVDSTSCFSWGSAGGTNAWSRCDTVTSNKEVIVKEVIVEKKVPVVVIKEVPAKKKGE